MSYVVGTFEEDRMNEAMRSGVSASFSQEEADAADAAERARDEALKNAKYQQQMDALAAQHRATLQAQSQQQAQQQAQQQQKMSTARQLVARQRKSSFFVEHGLLIGGLAAFVGLATVTFLVMKK